MCEKCLQFTHLHVHTDSSRIDGLGPIHRTVQAAKDLGFKALAVTDHGTLSNSIAFTASAKHIGIKPILGMEAYVGRDGRRFHLSLLADGQKGFKTLVDLNNLGQRSDDASKPTFPLEALRKHNEGLIVLSGCPASPMQELDWPDARQIASELKSIFGGRFFAELMFIGSYNTPWERSAKLVQDLDLVPIVTNDVHFPYAADAASHKILVQMKANFEYESRNLFLATPEELRLRVRAMAPDYLDILEMGMANAYKLAGKLRPVAFDDKPKLPHIPDANSALISAVQAGLASKFPMGAPDEYLARITDELGVIQDMDFASYFLILSDIIQFAKAKGVRIGPGRGSGAGCLVLFLLDCTEIDPIKYGLSFDRFLNRRRKEMPDVDTDIDAEYRDVVINYAHDRWGAMPVATYSRYSHKSLTHDLARVFRSPRELDAKAAEEGPDSPAFKQLTKDYPGFKPTYDICMDQIRHVGKHAGGIVIVDPSIPVPMERTADGGLVVGWTEGEFRELSQAGIVKFDMLGLTALSVLRRLEERHGCRAADPVDDDPVFELFQTGDLLGIFQFAGSQGIRDFTVKVSPHTLEDLIAINALYRPGALDSGATEMYPEWKKSPRSLHPFIDDILAPTFGVICYQEQFMQIYARMTDGDMSDADIARKVLAKARPGQLDWEEKMAKLKADFFDGADKHGIDPVTTDTIWGEIVTHTRYSFNRSHSVAYAHVAWQMAWWKYYHRTDFFAALLTVDRAEWERYLFDVVASGVDVVPPHINTSTEDFISQDGKLYLPLTVVKHLGGVGVKAIIDAQPFKDVADYMARVPKKAVTGRARLGLWQIGAMDGLGADAKSLGVEDPGELTKLEKEDRFMGMHLPDAKFLKRLDKARRGGYVAGIVISKEQRTSSYGKYFVFKLMPDGAFWSRNHDWLEVGAAVKCKVHQANGKLLSVDDL